MNGKAGWQLIQEAGNGWLDDKVPRMSAALAYYTILSVAPLLVIALGIAGQFLGPQQVQDAVVKQLGGLVGEEGGKAIQTMIAHASNLGSSVTAIIVGGIVLLFGASGVFAELQDALNTIWEVQPKPGRPVWTIIRERFLSFAMVLGTCFLLLVSLVVSAVLAALTQWMGWGAEGVVGQVLTFCISFGVITLLFAMIFKVLPDVKIAWGDVWVGALATAFLFTVGKLLIGLYLGHASVGSAYGAAGSLVVFVVWVYYSAQILYFGAEFTKAYANHFGSHIRPTENAEPLTQEARAQQGIPRSAPSAAQPSAAGR
jgi:membrane protein